MKHSIKFKALKLIVRAKQALTPEVLKNFFRNMWNVIVFILWLGCLTFFVAALIYPNLMVIVVSLIGAFFIPCMVNVED